MPNVERVSINAMGRKLQQQSPMNDEDKMRSKIVELKGKIMMTEKLRASIKEKNEAEVARNEKEISELRMGNSQMRGTVRRALDINEILLSEVLADRKRQRLALSGKPGETVIKELDQTVCNLERKLNDLSFTKKKRQDKLNEVQKRYFVSTQAPEVQPEFSSRARQLQNSINKVNLKKSSAFHVQGLYAKILRALEGDLRKYPKLLDEFEKQILTQRTELQTLQEMQHTAFEERDVAQHETLNFEMSVREKRRKRETAMRAFRNRVKEVAAEKDLPQTRAKQTRHTIDEKHLAQMARRTQERLDKIKMYQEKANMLELVTGISFSNKESLINCFKNQKNSSTLLQAQTKAKRTMIQKKRKTLEQYEAVYQKLIHEHEKNIDENTRILREKSEDALITKDRLSVANAKTSDLMIQICTWLRPITTWLIKSCEILNVKHIDALIWKANQYTQRSDKDLELGRLFTILSDVICALDKQGRLNAQESATFWEDMARKDEDVLVSNNNNRILLTLEREVSDDFDYNTPNNEEYLSRAAIKRQAEGKQGTRFEKI